MKILYNYTKYNIPYKKHVDTIMNTILESCVFCGFNIRFKIINITSASHILLFSTVCYRNKMFENANLAAVLLTKSSVLSLWFSVLLLERVVEKDIRLIDMKR